MASQTDESEVAHKGGFLVFVSSVTSEGAPTQVTHAHLATVDTNTVDTTVGAPFSPTKKSVGTGSIDRTSVLQDYDSVRR